jgi:hypothetical protein
MRDKNDDAVVEITKSCDVKHGLKSRLRGESITYRN